MMLNDVGWWVSLAHGVAVPENMAPDITVDPRTTRSCFRHCWQTCTTCTDTYDLYRHVRPVQTRTTCTDTYDLYRHVRPVQTRTTCTDTYDLYRHIRPVQTRTTCTDTYDLYRHVRPVQTCTTCTDTYDLYRHVRPVYLYVNSPVIGNVSDCRKCRHKQTGKEYAVKIVSRRIDCSREVHTLRLCQGHPNIVTLQKVCHDEVTWWRRHCLRCLVSCWTVGELSAWCTRPVLGCWICCDVASEAILGTSLSKHSLLMSASEITYDECGPPLVM